VTDPFASAALGDAAAAARSEWRADEEAWTRAAVEQWRHNRSLRDVVRDAMHRGDRVAMVFPAVVFTGFVAAVGDDVVVLDTLDGLVDVNVDARAPLVVRVVERAHTGGTRGARVTTLRMRALELETDGCDVRIGCSLSPTIVEGPIRVGCDHVVVAERDGDVVVALAAVAWMRRVSGR
jgi:hypothetical protein